MATVTSKTLHDFNQAEMERRGQIEPNDAPTVRGLQDAVKAAIERHTSFRQGSPERVANSKAAALAVAKHMGVNANGQPKALLNENMKLQKAQNGYELDGKDTIQMPDGRGVETTGLALSPAYEEGKFNTCPNSASCKKICLGKTSGNYFQLGGGRDLAALKGPRLSSHNRTQAFLRDPGAFAVRLHDEILTKKFQADMNGNQLGVRLNVLSDLHPKILKPIMDAHPDVQFYDYTKNNTAPVAPNHHLTYSSTGVSHPELGVENLHQNWHSMRNKLETGRNVAMAFSHGAELPDTVHDAETGHHYKVINGDLHDFRPIDGKDENGKGFIVGLKNKAATTTNAESTKQSGGFFVHYDPKYLMDGKKMARDTTQTPKIDKNGKETYPPIVTNRTVVIPKQKARNTFLDNDSNIVPIHKED